MTARTAPFNVRGLSIRNRNMYIYIYGFLLFLDELVFSMSGSSALSESGHQDSMDCLRATEKCNQDQKCSHRFRIMRQCLAGKDRNTMLANRDCQVALEVLQEMALFDCRCKRGMKKEMQCLQSYWSINIGLTEGEDFYEPSPYEPMTPHRHSDAFRLASIISGIHSGTSKGQPHCSDPSRPCNPCLDATKACNLNENCKRQRSNYISTCTRAQTQGQQPSQPQSQDSCNRKRCHKALRQFFERVDTQYSYGLLFCSCKDQACAERRRQTIVPSCSYQDKTKPNCLQLRNTCRLDVHCRSRLADFHTNCQMTPHSISSCLNDDYQACLASYTRLIGTDMTPNYMDSGHSNFTISPWCTCRGSGNQEEECEKFLQDFRENTCLRNAIQAFGYGSLPKPDPQPTTGSAKPDLEPTAIVSKTTMEPGEEPCIISSCANLNELDCYPSKDYICESEVPGSPPNTRVEDPRNSSPGTKALTAALMLGLLFAFESLTM
ncbi:GDNF family receptor alpha-2a isoform X1 [Labeo rohita]|uniref:GDNF family receptor alpha-2a isoform X1 n=1 Tax=Labeo rohita TaxID=84645 RepID=UPI0021E23C2E|nr:GDNF family receptor alpha-2a isoform X1 [Labeo rohita]XP_050973648.1 GDNF family receptor alpha-2a isoform X1 [Labeo rohita]